MGGPVPAAVFEAVYSDPIAGAERSGILRIAVSGGVVMARLDQEDRNRADSGEYAFPEERKEPLKDARHVRNAVARFNQVKGVTDAERDEAWTRIEAAAKKFGVELEERSWRDLKPPKR